MSKAEQTSDNSKQGNSSLGVVIGSSYTEKEAKTILENVDFPNGLTTKQQLKVLWWTMFNKNRFWRFVKRIV
jgi:hypothetical protein